MSAYVMNSEFWRSCIFLIFDSAMCFSSSVLFGLLPRQVEEKMYKGNQRELYQTKLYKWDAEQGLSEMNRKNTKISSDRSIMRARIGYVLKRIGT